MNNNNTSQQRTWTEIDLTEVEPRKPECQNARIRLACVSSTPFQSSCRPVFRDRNRDRDSESIMRVKLLFFNNFSTILQSYLMLTILSFQRYFSSFSHLRAYSALWRTQKSTLFVINYIIMHFHRFQLA